VKLPVVLIAVFSVFALIACTSSPDFEVAATLLSDEVQVNQGSYLEESARDIGVRKDESGHLFVDGNADTQFLRLLTYFNLEAKVAADEGAKKLHKISGFYNGGSFGEDGYTDGVLYEIQISHDDFESLSDLTPFLEKGNLSFSPGGYLISKDEDPYGGLNTMLAYRNAEAASGDREYKLKAWYEAKHLRDEFVSDSVYITIQFSFEESIRPPTEDSALYRRNSSFGEQRQESIIAQAAVEFSQLLSKPKELAVLTFDFSGDNRQGLSQAYMFEASDIAKLHEVLAGTTTWGVSEILSLAEVKRPAGRYIVAGEIVNKSGLPQNAAERSEEPIGQESIEIVARIVSETSRVINPTSIEVIIHEFAGNTPNDLTTWSYQFDKEDIEEIRIQELPAEEIVGKGSVVEQVWFIPGDRSIPPAKPLIK